MIKGWARFMYEQFMHLNFASLWLSSWNSQKTNVH